MSDPINSDKAMEDVLKNKSSKRGFMKAFSFGNTNNENSILFQAGSIDQDEQRDREPSMIEDDPEKQVLIPKDKTDIVGATNGKTFINIVKSFVGTGILFLPSAFKNGGVIFSVILLAFLSVLTLGCMLLLVACWEKNRGSFGEIAERAYGKPGKLFVDTTLVVAQLSFGSVYQVFVAKTLLQVIFIEWELWHIILLEIPLLTPFVWIRHVYKLSIANFIGTMCIIFGAIYITYYSIDEMVANGAKPVDLFNNKDWALFLGTAIFTFEGIGTVIPIQQSMREKEKFKGLLTAAIFSISAVLASFAIIGYIAFGDDILGPITLNLDEDLVMVKIVLALYALAIFFSYPLIVFPAVEILSKLIFPEGPVTVARKWKKNLFRFFLVCLTGAVAIVGGDDFEKFVSLIGGFACTPLGFVFPALFHYKLVASTKFQKNLDILIAIVGVILGIFATGYSLFSWIKESPDEGETGPPVTPTNSSMFN